MVVIDDDKGRIDIWVMNLVELKKNGYKDVIWGLRFFIRESFMNRDYIVYKGVILVVVVVLK